MLAYPDGNPLEQNVFFDRVASLLNPTVWVAAFFNPPPWNKTRDRIEEDCDGVLIRLDMPPKEVAWLCTYNDLNKALPGLFSALIPELILIGFDFKPSAREIELSRNSTDAKPASILLIFDEGTLWEVRNGEGTLSIY